MSIQSKQTCSSPNIRLMLDQPLYKLMYGMSSILSSCCGSTLNYLKTITEDFEDPRVL